MRYNLYKIIYFAVTFSGRTSTQFWSFFFSFSILLLICVDVVMEKSLKLSVSFSLLDKKNFQQNVCLDIKMQIGKEHSSRNYHFSNFEILYQNFWFRILFFLNLQVKFAVFLEASISYLALSTFYLISLKLIVDLYS